MERRTLNFAALREVIEGGVAWFRQSATSYILACPTCGKAKLHVRKRDGRSKCFRCGDSSSGWADKALALVTGRRRSELADLLYGVVAGSGPTIDDEEGLDWPYPDGAGDIEDESEVVVGVEEPLPPMILDDPGFISLTARGATKAVEYLAGRGVTLDLATKYGLKYLPREHRVIIPVVVEGVQRGWQARTIDPSSGVSEDGHDWAIPKILTTGKVTGKVLMFEDRLIGSEHAIMTEGPFDAIACDCLGGNTATMGCGEAVRLLPRYLRAGIKKLYVGLDDDAHDHIQAVADAMYSHPEVALYRLEPPRGREDLGACSPGEVLEQFHAAKPLWRGQLYSYLRDPVF